MRCPTFEEVLESASKAEEQIKSWPLWKRKVMEMEANSRIHSDEDGSIRIVPPISEWEFHYTSPGDWD